MRWRDLVRGAALGPALLLAACSGDDGKPSGPTIVVVQDGGSTPSEDAATGDGGGKKGLAEDCSGDDECESGVCFVGGRASWCSKVCTPANAAEICKPPEFDGACNNQGRCRRPN